MRTQFSISSSIPTASSAPDWIVTLLPTAIALRMFSNRASLVFVAFLLVVAFLRKSEARFAIKPGPLVLLILSALIVFSRPLTIGPVLTFLLVSVLIFRLVATVDARRMIASLIDGAGLYILVNVVFHLVGIVSPSADARLGGLVQSSTGFVRIAYPLSSSINSAPLIAAVYVTSVIFLIRQPGWIRRSIRVVFFLAATSVLIGSGSRGALAIAVALSLVVIFLPVVTRWLVQGAALFAAISSLVLPSIIIAFEFVVSPLLSLARGRISDTRSVSTLESRDYIWDHAIRYWVDWVNEVPHILLGYGVTGQYRSGASLSYSGALSGLIRDPELAFVHNSFLQQLFDGGIVGCILLMVAAFWAGSRFSRRRRDWGVAAIVAMAVILLGAMTEASMAPGVAEESFWLLVALVGISCQAGRTITADGGPGRRQFADSDDPMVRTDLVDVGEAPTRQPESS